MSQRSQTNDRYRKDADVGSTRKSAASAKPVRKAATVEIGSGKDTGKGKGKKGAKGLKSVKGSKATKPAKPKPVQPPMPTSPEIKKSRTVWWALLGLAFVLLAVAWFVPAIRTNMTANTAVTVAVFALCAGGLYIDLVVIRKLRNKLIAEQKGKKVSNSVSAKAGSAAAKQPAKAQDAKGADEAPASIVSESTSPLGGLFKKKKG